MLDILLQDLRFALRMLQKNPGFASSGVSAIASTPLDLIHARDGSAKEAIFTPASGLFTGQCLICRIIGKVPPSTLSFRLPGLPGADEGAAVKTQTCIKLI